MAIQLVRFSNECKGQCFNSQQDPTRILSPAILYPTISLTSSPIICPLSRGTLTSVLSVNSFKCSCLKAFAITAFLPKTLSHTLFHMACNPLLLSVFLSNVIFLESSPDHTRVSFYNCHYLIFHINLITYLYSNWGSKKISSIRAGTLSVLFNYIFPVPGT